MVPKSGYLVSIIGGKKCQRNVISCDPDVFQCIASDCGCLLLQKHHVTLVASHCTYNRTRAFVTPL